MNETIAIARRELAEKKFVLVAPLASAIIILIFPLLPHVRSDRWREIYAVGSTIFTVLFVLGIATMLGVSTIGRELTDRRLSFYFTKPIAAPAIWFGKLLGSVLLIAATGFVAMAPAFVAGRRMLHEIWTTGNRDFFDIFLIATVTLFFLGHVFSTIARSRSSWALLDLAAIAALAYAAWWIAQPLLMQGASEMLTVIVEILGWLLLAAVIAAGAWQLAMGRTDRLQSHRALSQFLWPAAVTAFAICGLIVAWVVTASPDDLTGEFSVRSAPQGDYAFVSGVGAHRKDYHPLFLMNVRDGAYTRIEGIPLRGGFSSDGRKVVMIKPVSTDSRGRLGEVVVRDVAIDGHEEVTGPIIGMKTWTAVASPDATRLAYGSESVLSFYDLVQKRSLGSMRLPQGRLQSVWFASPDVVRLFIVNPESSGQQTIWRTLDIYEYDVRARSYSKTGSFQKEDHSLFFTASADGSRLFVRNAHDVVMLDGRTGVPLTSFPGLSGVVMMADGRMIGIGSTLRIMNSAGVVEKEVPVEPDLWFVRPLTADKALIGVRVGNPETWRLSVIDVKTGNIVRREQNLRPLFADMPYIDVRRTAMNPEQLFTDPKGNLVRWNPLTNEKNVVINAKG